MPAGMRCFKENLNVFCILHFSKRFIGEVAEIY